MNAVWILTALWGSYLALWAYNKFGQGAPMKMGGGEMKMDMSGMKDMNMDMCDGRYVYGNVLIGSLWLYRLYIVEQAAHWPI